MAPNSSRKRKSSDSGDDEERRISVCAPSASNQYPPPILCSFPGGVPLALEREDDSVQDPVKFQIQSTSQGNLIVGKDSVCSYSNVQQIEEAQQHSSRLCVGIYDKDKKTLTLHEVSGNGQVVPLSQSMHDYNKGETDQTVNLMEQRQALFGEFGSAGKRRQIKSMEANRVDVETVVGSGHLVVDSVLQGQSMSESNKQAIHDKREQRENGDTQTPGGRRSKAIEDATERWRKDFLPSFDLKASEPHEVYNPKEIVGGKYIFDYFRSHVTKCLERENVASALIDGLDWEEEESLKPASVKIEDINEGEESEEKRRAPRSYRREWQPSVVALVRRILSIKNEHEKSRRLTLALALFHMSNLYLKLSNRHSIPSEVKKRYFGAPSSFARFWLETFTVESIDPDGQTSRAMSKHYKDKCVMYMILLLLIADGGKDVSCADVRPFTDDLRMNIKDIIHLLRESGCTVKNIKAMTSAKLTVPLTFPPPRRGPRKSPSAY